MSSSPLAERALGQGGDPVVQFGQGGGEGGDLGGGSHPPMMAAWAGAGPAPEARAGKGPAGPAGSLVTSCPSAPWTSAARRRPTRRSCRARRTPGPTSTTWWPRSCARCAPRGTRRSSATRRELDRVDVSDGLRVPAAEIEKACADADPALWQALEVAFGRILAYHAHEGTPPGDLVEGGITVGHLTRAVERAGIYAPGGRARYPSTVLMCAAPARVAGVGSIALCVPPAADGQDRHRHAVRRLHRRRGRGVPDRRGPGHRRHGLRDAPACRPSTSSPARATPTWPRPSASCRASSAWRRPSPAPPRSWSSPARTRRRPSPPSTWSCRPSTGPTGWPGW